MTDYVYYIPAGFHKRGNCIELKPKQPYRIPYRSFGGSFIFRYRKK